jgi:hypothetical protein
MDEERSSFYHPLMSTKDDAPNEELPATPLAGLVSAAKEKLAAKVDRHGPAAVKAMAAIVRDLKGMPELVVTRESATRIKLTRKGKVGFIVVEYDAAILSIDMSVGGFSEAREPGAPKAVRYSLADDDWKSMTTGDDLFADLKLHLVRLYPELEKE